MFWISVSCLWSDQSEFMAFNLWIGSGYIFELRLWSYQSEFMVVFMAFNLWIGSGYIFECCS